jgi:type II secretory pathway pseudopilin PulG
MAALIVGLSVMAVLLTAAMPVWKQLAQREKEAELIFRGQQYARAIALFQRRNGPGALPPNVTVLVEQRFLRKKYKDPITNDDFQPLTAGQVAPGSTAPGRGAAAPQQAAGRGSAGGVGSTQPGVPAGGVMGVVSKSPDESIRLYNGRNHYNEWAFIYTPPASTPGARGGAPPGVGQRQGGPGPGRGVPGQISNDGGRRGGFGVTPPQQPPPVRRGR